MKTLITSLLLLVSGVISAQVDQTKKPLVNEYTVSTPAKDSLFILDCEAGRRMREIWQKDPEDNGYCPIIVMVSDLTPIKQRFNYNSSKNKRKKS
jgi:hypothetical protein